VETKRDKSRLKERRVRKKCGGKIPLEDHKATEEHQEKKRGHPRPS